MWRIETEGFEFDDQAYNKLPDFLSYKVLQLYETLKKMLLVYHDVSRFTDQFMIFAVCF